MQPHEYTVQANGELLIPVAGSKVDSPAHPSQHVLNKLKTSKKGSGLSSAN